MTLADRFFAKVSPEPNTGCWLWTGATERNGYGMIWVDGRLRPAHRVSLTIAGRTPGALCALHSCDTPSCVNPAHLRLGTQAENMGDMAKRQRQARGDRLSKKLTSTGIREIRARHAAGESQGQLARAFRVTQSMVSRIVRRERWAAA
jgi:hypothetical protein